ncbi:MAG: hypothetical protein NUV82_03480 [Candidatus Komeilibacteria bacterium]|nr:hypothetical protein [Candidatus Komeilibacteria bacterium]
MSKIEYKKPAADELSELALDERGIPKKLDDQTEPDELVEHYYKKFDFQSTIPGHLVKPLNKKDYFASEIENYVVTSPAAAKDLLDEYVTEYEKVKDNLEEGLSRAYDAKAQYSQIRRDTVGLRLLQTIEVDILTINLNLKKVEKLMEYLKEKSLAVVIGKEKK